MTQNASPLDQAREKKRTLRSTMRGVRADCAHYGTHAAEKARDFFEQLCLLPVETIVAGYRAYDSELDPLPLLRDLAARGCRLALPCVGAPDAPLTFRAYAEGDPLTQGPHTIEEPVTTAFPLEPDFLLVPLLAFDRFGGRLGSGAGYYDRTLEALRRKKKIQAVGFAYALQETRLVPICPGDQCLDAVVTEKGWAYQGGAFRAAFGRRPLQEE